MPYIIKCSKLVSGNNITEVFQRSPKDETDLNRNQTASQIKFCNYKDVNQQSFKHSFHTRTTGCHFFFFLNPKEQFLFWNLDQQKRTKQTV